MADPKRMARAIANALDGAAKGVLIDFKTTTSSWRHKPSFQTSSPSPYERIVGTSDEIYGYVNNGTRAHTIRPRGRRLRFASGYRAKTRPGVIGSTGGGPFGSPVFARVVHHPGTAARHFDEAIAKKWQAQLPVIMQRAIDSEIR
jgi:hypothetical protein